MLSCAQTHGSWLSIVKKVLTVVTRHVDWTIVRCLVIAGPGFTKEEFRKYLDQKLSGEISGGGVDDYGELTPERCGAFQPHSEAAGARAGSVPLHAAAAPGGNHV